MKNVFEDSAVGNEDCVRSGVAAQPLPKITRVKKEAVRAFMSFPALLDFACVEIDAVESGDGLELVGKPLENAAITRPYLDQANIPVAEEREHP